MKQTIMDKIANQIAQLLNDIADGIDDEQEYLNALRIAQRLFNSAVQTIIQETDDDKKSN